MINFLESEKIIFKKRRHWFVIAMEIIPIAFFALLPLLALALGIYVPIIEIIILKYFIFVSFFTVVFWLLLWFAFSIIWTNYYLDVLIITNKRIIDIEQLGLFARDITEVRIDNIEDVKTEIIGIIASLLNMGNLYIQTAGESREMIIKNIVDPHGIREVIGKCHDEFSKTKT